VVEQDSRRFSAPVIRSEARGPHWIAWKATPDGKPAGSIVLVGQTRTEAEERARRWAERQAGLAGDVA
jgi:hypothetical protein